MHVFNNIYEVPKDFAQNVRCLNQHQHTNKFRSHKHRMHTCACSLHALLYFGHQIPVHCPTETIKATFQSATKPK